MCGEAMEGKSKATSSSAPATSLSCPRDDEAGEDNEEFHDASEEPEMDPIEECKQFVARERISGEEAKAKVLADASLRPPAQSKEDWDAEITRLRGVAADSGSAEEKIRVLQEALELRIADVQKQEEHKASMLRRLDDATKERDRLKLEMTRISSTKVKLEMSCRDLQTQKASLAQENSSIAEAEQAKHAELKEKFQQAIKDVQEKMDAELEVQQHFVKENDELRGKLDKFSETWDAQQAQLAEQREAREKEMDMATKRLKEHEEMCAQSKVKAVQLEKENEAMRKSQAELRKELQSILAKFDEFHEAVTESNSRHSECKAEVDDLSVKLQALEDENVDLKENKALQELQQETQVAQKQRDALEKLCDNLEKENRKQKNKK
eukprot:TRINITY_DN32574_c0_g1_i2.p1 TRINITY_DN32574_c0_g1~~TRINITY_DN32574_c0_g1_i2.p1  ORF type:complete len:381 (+),score=136.72 TRINITY_DN32574_c0_g1_i2:159-1301(+)